jgi:mannosyltransferase OCH1-like enzyme
MIPKIIYFSWISPDPIPERFLPYIESWKRIMPDYEIRQLSLENLDKKSPFVQECLKRENYAIAGHFERCRALYETGGIYFDVDIEAIKPLDDLLNQDFFVGKEDLTVINNAVVGSVAGYPFLKKCMEFMESFDFSQDHIELRTGPWMFTELIDKEKVYPPMYFYPYSYKETYSPSCITPYTYVVHHWAKTWQK